MLPESVGHGHSFLSLCLCGKARSYFPREYVSNQLDPARVIVTPTSNLSYDHTIQRVDGIGSQRPALRYGSVHLADDLIGCFQEVHLLSDWSHDLHLHMEVVRHDPFVDGCFWI